MIETWTQDDLDLFEEVTGIKCRVPISFQNLPSRPAIGDLIAKFSKEWLALMTEYEIIESVILLAHSIPRKDLEEMLR